MVALEISEKGIIQFPITQLQPKGVGNQREPGWGYKYIPYPE